MALIAVDRVSKRFQIPSVRRETVREHVFDLFRPRPFHTLQVLDEVSFEVERGETVGIMGRNGSGKSTLLRILAGIYQPDSGSVAIRAPVTPILELGVGWDPALDAVDNVFLIGTLMGLSLREVRAGLDEILAFAGLEAFANLELRHFSTGMAARLAYSVAFKAVREVLLLDEVLAVGDAGFKTRCEARYRELNRAGHTVIVVSHEPRIVSSYCTRAFLLDGGRIVGEGPGSQIGPEYMALLTGAAVAHRP